MKHANPDNNEMVARRAYEHWLAEGRPHGHDQAHWLKAERELAAQERKARKATGADGAKNKVKSPKSKSGKAKSAKAK